MHIDSPKVRRAAGWIGAFALPVLIVQVVGWMSGSAGPSRARATEMKDSAAVSPAETTVQKIAIDEGARNRVSLSDRAVVDRIKQLRDVPFDSTPMLHAPVEQQPPSSVEASVPDFQLQAVMSGSASHAAHVLINGRVCALGETVPGTDWIVAEIHADERSIMLEHQATNRTVTLSLRPLH